MNKTRLLVFLLLFILLPGITYADCTEEEINHFKEIEDQYKVTYEYDKEIDNYTLILTRAEPDMYDYYFYNDTNVALDCEEFDNGVAQCYNIPPGYQRLVIMGQTDSCSMVFRDDSITLTPYNNFYKDELCEGIEEFVLCQPTYDKELDYETFVSRVKIYKKTKEKKAAEEQAKKQQEKKEQVNKIIEYIKENILMIILAIVLAIAVVVTIILTAKSIRKSRRLE